MTDDVLKELRRQQEWINDFLEPSRRMQEEILRSLAPVMQIKDSLRMVTDNLASMGVTGDILRSMEKIGRVELADYSSIAALSAAERDLAGVTDAIKQQSRWIEETSGLSLAKDKWILADSGALAAIEKLAASQNALLDASRWLIPRPLSSAITDILLAGRSEWALSFRRVSKDEARVEHVSRASERVIGELASIEDDAVIAVPPGDAKREATSVARLLSERVLLSPRGEGPLLIGYEEVEAFGHVRTIFEVLRFLSSRSAKPLYGGFGVWLMGAGLDIVDRQRPAQDRFNSAVTSLHDAFIDGVRNADATLAAKVPDFFLRTVRGLRDTSAAHIPEAAMKHPRIVPNLRERERHFQSLVGKVPVSEIEWLAALGVLLRMAAEAAIEFRDRLA